ncbi:MAG: hypothetical protein Q8N63_07960, partial [Nanoarchaeota archaeon]|nr:hypothetical protein [Nanoarchaeota archaeon]
LEKMGYNYNANAKTVLIPAWRVDVLHEVDLIEDIAIAYGYENFKSDTSGIIGIPDSAQKSKISDIPQVSGTGKESSSEIKKRKIAEILTGLGILETSSLHLLTKEDLEKSGIKNTIELENSKTDYKFLRKDILTSSLKILSSNSDAEYPQKIFEIGTSFSADEKEETGIKESSKLAVSLAPGNFTEIRQVLEYLGRMLGASFSIEEAHDSRFIEGRVGKIILDNKDIGVLGELAPQTLNNWKIKMPAASLELDVDEIRN